MLVPKGEAVPFELPNVDIGALCPPPKRFDGGATPNAKGGAPLVGVVAPDPGAAPKRFAPDTPPPKMLAGGALLVDPKAKGAEDAAGAGAGAPKLNAPAVED